MVIRASNSHHPAPLSTISKRVLDKRYLGSSHGQSSEAPDDMFRRVARALAEAELKYNPTANVNSLTEEFYRLMSRLDFLPNSPALLNAGSSAGQLAACFALPTEDSIESMGDTILN